MSSAYYDANYLFKLLCLEPGSNEVRAHAATRPFSCTAAHGWAEFASAAFRKVREGAATPDHFRLALAQMRADAATGNLQFLPLTDAVFDRLETVYSSADVRHSAHPAPPQKTRQRNASAEGVRPEWHPLAHLLARQSQCLAAKGIADAEVICIQSVEQRTHLSDHAFLLSFNY